MWIGVFIFVHLGTLGREEAPCHFYRKSARRGAWWLKVFIAAIAQNEKIILFINITYSHKNEGHRRNR